MSKVKYPEYKLQTRPRVGRVVTKDGHTMMIQDIWMDLNRKSYLEEEHEKLRQRVLELEGRLTASREIAEYERRRNHE